MEKYKIDLFEKENPSHQFPAFTKMNTDTATSIIQRLSRQLGLVGPTEGKQAVMLLSQTTQRLEAINATAANFDLNQVLSMTGITPKPVVYINWYHFDEIDVIKLKDLITWFDDIWFPAVDDVDILDETCSWVISIDHDGYVSYRTF